MNKDNRLLLDHIRRIAWAAMRAGESLGGWWRDPFRELCEEIVSQEKSHRRLAPEGHKHKISVREACDYFVVRVLTEGWDAPDKTLASFRDVRSDYLMGALLMCDEKFRAHFVDMLCQEFPDLSPADVRGFMETTCGADYAVFTGSNTKPDDAHMGAIELARKFAV